MKTRRDFLNKLGVGAASALTIPLLSSFDGSPETKIIETKEIKNNFDIFPGFG